MSKPATVPDSESCSKKIATFRFVARDAALTAFVGKLIADRMKETGGTSEDVARFVGVTPSNVSQVRRGRLGVGTLTGKRFAVAFGFGTLSQLMAAAEVWWTEHGAAASELVSSPTEKPWPERAEALEVVRDMTSATDGELTQIIAAYGADLFRARSKEWWISTLLLEVKQERDRVRQSAAETEQGEAVERLAQKGAKRAWQLGAELKRDKARALSTVPPPPVPATVHAARKKPRRSGAG